MHQDRPARPWSSRSQQFRAGAAIGESGINQLVAKMGNSGLAASQHFIESQLLDFADSRHPVAKNLTIVKVRRVHCVAGMAKPFSPLQHTWPETVGGMKHHNFMPAHRSPPAKSRLSSASLDHTCRIGEPNGKCSPRGTPANPSQYEPDN